LPKRIQVLVKNIQEAQRRAAEAKKQRESEGSIDLSMFTGMYEAAEEAAADIEQMDDFEIFGIQSDKNDGKNDAQISDEDIFGLAQNNDDDDDGDLTW
ncbi:MAG: hypothetical protein AB7G87_03855, partial [Clostridia bacterium]